MKLLVDECLSEELSKLARRKGHPESSHVAWIGKRGSKDWELRPIIIEGDWTFVTKNSVDFRGPRDAPGSRGQYSEIELHAGLICLNASAGMDLDLQLELFGIALRELNRNSDLVNQVLEVTSLEPGGKIEILRYRLPS
jgi:hypothetical protein